MDFVNTYCYETIQNLAVFSGFQMAFDKMATIFSGFQIVWLSDFRSHSKSRTFENQPLLGHLKSRQVQISDPHYGGGLISSKDTEMN